MSITIPHLNEIRIVRATNAADPKKIEYRVSAVFPLQDSENMQLVAVGDSQLAQISKEQFKTIDALFADYLRAFRKARRSEQTNKRRKR